MLKLTEDQINKWFGWFLDILPYIIGITLGSIIFVWLILLIRLLYLVTMHFVLIKVV